MFLKLNKDERTVETLSGNRYLTKKEYEILEYLMDREGQYMPAEEIYADVWQAEPFDCRSVIAVHIRHIREKIEINPAEPRYLKVVWGQGYKMESDMR